MTRAGALGIVTIAGAVAIAAAPFAADQAAAPVAPNVAQIEKVKDNLYMITGGGGNTAAFVTGNGVVLVDTKLVATPLARIRVRLLALGTALVEVLVGIAGICVGVITRSLRRRAQGEARVARAAGRFCGGLGFQYREYARD